MVPDPFHRCAEWNVLWVSAAPGCPVLPHWRAGLCWLCYSSSVTGWPGSLIILNDYLKECAALPSSPSTFPNSWERMTSAHAQAFPSGGRMWKHPRPMHKDKSLEALLGSVHWVYQHHHPLTGVRWTLLDELQTWTQWSLWAPSNSEHSVILPFWSVSWGPAISACSKPGHLALGLEEQPQTLCSSPFWLPELLCFTFGIAALNHESTSSRTTAVCDHAFLKQKRPAPFLWNHAGNKYLCSSQAFVYLLNTC